MRLIDLATIRPVPYELGKKRHQEDRIQVGKDRPGLTLLLGGRGEEILVLDGTRIAARIPRTAVLAFELDAVHREDELEELLDIVGKDDPLAKDLLAELAKLKDDDAAAAEREAEVLKATAPARARATAAELDAAAATTKPESE